MGVGAARTPLYGGAQWVWACSSALCEWPGPRCTEALSGCGRALQHRVNRRPRPLRCWLCYRGCHVGRSGKEAAHQGPRAEDSLPTPWRQCRALRAAPPGWQGQPSSPRPSAVCLVVPARRPLNGWLDVGSPGTQTPAGTGAPPSTLSSLTRVLHLRLQVRRAAGTSGLGTLGAPGRCPQGRHCKAWSSDGS